MVRLLKSAKTWGATLGVAVALISGNCWAQQKDPCLNKQTQGELNACESEQYGKADVELNRVYQELLAKYSSHKEFISKLRAAEEAWIKFRDADLDSYYYAKNKLAVYGSAYPMCRAISLTQLTLERTKELRQMLNPNEDDVCGFVVSQESSAGLANPHRIRASCVRQLGAPRGH